MLRLANTSARISYSPSTDHVFSQTASPAYRLLQNSAVVSSPLAHVCRPSYLQLAGSNVPCNTWPGLPMFLQILLAGMPQSAQIRSCQVCLFIRQTEDSVVHRVSPKEVLTGKQKLPFTSRPAWVSIQSECSDLRRTHAHLLQGTRPSKKLTNIRDVKRYLRVATIARDGLLVVRREQALLSPRECIIVPRSVLDGLLTSLHLQLDHPTNHQLKTVVNRHFFALDMDSSITRVTDSCHQCASLRNAPHTVVPQTTSEPPRSRWYYFCR